MNKNRMVRYLGSLALIFVGFSAPWWVFFICGLIAVAYFESFYEFVGICFLVDTLAGASLDIYLGIHYLLTTFSLISILIIEFLRKKMW